MDTSPDDHYLAVGTGKGTVYAFKMEFINQKKAYIHAKFDDLHDDQLHTTTFIQKG